MNSRARDYGTPYMYTLRVYPLSPVHVGGHNADNIDVIRGSVRDVEVLIYINVPRLLSSLPEDALRQMKRYLESGKTFDESLQATCALPSAQEAVRDFRIRTVPLLPGTDPGTRPLRLFPFADIDRSPYLPGSSLKGSLKTALGLPHGDTKTLYGIRISDSYDPLPATHVAVAKRKQKILREKKSEIPLNVEAWLPPYISGSDDDPSTEIKLVIQKVPEGATLSFASIQKRVNEYYEALFEKNMREINSLSHGSATQIRGFLDDLRKRYPDGLLLRVGWGVGQESIQLPDSSAKKNSPKTFWLLETPRGVYPFGWVYCAKTGGGPVKDWK